MAETARVSLVALRVIVDLLAILIALGTAMLLRFQLGLFEVVESSPLTVRSHVQAASLWVVSLMGAVALNRLYDEDTLVEGGGETARVVRSITEAAAVFAVFVFLTQSFYVSRSWFGLTVVLSFVVLVAGRALIRRYLAAERARGRRRRGVILIARTDRELDGRFLRDVEEFEMVSTLDLEGLAAHLAGEAVIEPGGTRPPRDRPALLVHAADFDPDELWKLVLEAGAKGHPVFIHAAVRSVRRDRLTVRELGGQTIVKIAPPRLFGANALRKRLFDVAGAFLLSVVTLPISLVAAAAVLVSSGLPLFYVQERVGANGKLFRIVKFRTMRRDAEDESGPVWAARDDPRVTPVGGLLRRWGIDELPQLINVLRGDMSLVGPRPERPGFVTDFTDRHEWYRYRARIRPGVTGWAQARGLRGDTPLDPRIESDNWYIEHWSIALDIKILLRTIGEIARGERSP
jgi:exopolysaccharide biosynthesis polyprenyl glycosylphosphotransferase